MKKTKLLKGTLKPIVLKLLVDNERMYGYEITQNVKEISNGKVELTYGGLYPLLHKLEDDGEVITETEVIDNRVRKYYKLTKKGNDSARKKIKELEETIETLSVFLKPKSSVQLWRV